MAVTSPQLPPALTRSTILLPDVGTEWQLSPHAGVFHYKSVSAKSPDIEWESSLTSISAASLLISLFLHVPKDKIFALASPFGEIRRIRTFTRHVRNIESGYGFVLFETIEATEKCITSLRRHHNLHCAFSKVQIALHIKSTRSREPHVHIQLHSTPPGSSSPLAGWEQESRGDLGKDASFKAKMESLHGLASANLYMGGLPLSIDGPTLAVPVSPHRISSSRFFLDKVTQPPACHRVCEVCQWLLVVYGCINPSDGLETRAGVEETTEHPHDIRREGSRIRARFSITTKRWEQRNKDISWEGGNSLRRITIAQAVLLNLHGQELRSQATVGQQTRPISFLIAVSTVPKLLTRSSGCKSFVDAKHTSNPNLKILSSFSHS